MISPIKFVDVLICLQMKMPSNMYQKHAIYLQQSGGSGRKEPLCKKGLNLISTGVLWRLLKKIIKNNSSGQNVESEKVKCSQWGEVRTLFAMRCSAPGRSGSFIISWFYKVKIRYINASLEPKRTLIHFLKKNHLSWSSHHCHHYQYHNRHHYYLAWIVEQVSCNLCAGASIIIIIKSY